MRNPRLFNSDGWTQEHGAEYTTDITLRDILAGLNHAALLANVEYAGADVADLAADAIFHADAMLAQLDKEPEA